MPTEEGSEIPSHPNHQNLLDWLEDPVPFLPSILDEPYSISDDLTGYDWWDPTSDTIFDLPPAISIAASPSGPANPPLDLSIDQSPDQPRISKKRRNRPGNNSSDSEARRKQPVNTTGGKKTGGKLTGNNSNSSSKEVRWAEQLLNPLAAAIEASNLSRVQHLLYVLQELASPAGDCNHRLASHGLRALTRNLSANFTGGDGNPNPPTFATTEPKLFRSALIKFHEVSPWFAFPNSLANASILQTLTLDSTTNQRRQTQTQTQTLHVVDIGVSHGIQWPTLLEALTRRSSAAPSLVKLSIAGDAVPSGPLSSPPAGYDFPSHLLRYAKSIDLNLKIDHVSDLASINHSSSKNHEEILVVCVQFRAQHVHAERRSEFLMSLRGLDPDLVILTETEGGEGFARRAEMLWRFLDSTSSAFKGRDCAERRVLEGEMARALEEGEGVGGGEGRERWRERMLGLGFEEVGFGDEAVDGGRSLLRKYDGNWEMKTAGVGLGLGVGLWWKGQPVSFCSTWSTGQTTQGEG